MDAAVAVVKSYLELCGYFVLTELPVRVADQHGYHDATDLDILAVRFPHEPPALPARQVRPLEVLLGADPFLESLTDGLDLLVGEVKQGHARLNPALHRAETVAFALRRIGCCPEESIAAEARMIVKTGRHEMTMSGGQRCRVRLVAFAGQGTAHEYGVLTLSLGHCAQFIRERLRQARDVLATTQWKDPVLSLFALQEKLALQS
jgi:hypothetical protein